MTRSSLRSPILGSVSAVAMATFLAACSQPASYATVDLSGSYGGAAPQAYSALTGQPVYQSVSRYGPQSFPDAGDYVPTAQLAYTDAPENQVAALTMPGGGFDLFGIDARADAPQYSAPVTASPFSTPQLFSSPPFQQEVRAVDQVLQAPRPVAPAPFQPQAPVTAFEDVRPVSVGGIDEAPLSPPSLAPNREARDLRDRYTSTAGLVSDTAPGASQTAQTGWPGFEPWIAPQYGSEEDVASQVAPRPVAPFERPQTRPTTSPVDGFQSLARNRLAQRPQQTRLPAPSTEPAAPPARIGGGLRVPKASTEYPRPYALLRPGIWPELDIPGQGMVEAPATAQQPQLVAAAPPVVRQPTESISTASERFDGDVSASLSGTYDIQAGDTLLTIAQRLGLTPQQIADTNGIDPYAPIYVGQTLQLPAAPNSRAPNSIPESSVPLLNVAEIVTDESPSEIGGSRVPLVDVETVQTVMQHASIPVRPKTSDARKAQKQFSWPVHGDVYRLESGQVEIDPEGEASVAAAASGRVVHVERGPLGVLVVIEHDNGWRSLTVGLDYSAVRPGETVTQGSAIGVASRDHRVRFELRDADARVADTLSQLRG